MTLGTTFTSLMAHKIVLQCMASQANYLSSEEISFFSTPFGKLVESISLAYLQYIEEHETVVENKSVKRKVGDFTTFAI